jgi:hypothetical protein
VVVKRTDSVAIDVVRAVAAVEGADPATLQPPLADVVDPAALDRLYEGTGASPTVELEYKGHEVTVLAPGRVRVDGAPAGTPVREHPTDGVQTE